MLWGTCLEEEKEGFSLVSEGSEGRMGHRHAPPISARRLRFDSMAQRRRRPLRLQVRHYLAEDSETGLAYIARSRLVAVCTDEEVGK